MTFTLSFLWLLTLVTILARNQIVSIFTEDQELIEMTATVLIVVGISFLINGIQGVVQGPIRALGL